METLNLDELEMDRKSTAYWIEYSNHRGETIVSEKRYWIENFMIDAEKGTGRTDLNYTVRVEEAPSTMLRDWLESDVFVELHMSQPKFQFKIMEEG